MSLPPHSKNNVGVNFSKKIKNPYPMTTNFYNSILLIWNNPFLLILAIQLVVALYSLWRIFNQSNTTQKGQKWAKIPTSTNIKKD